MIAIRITLFLFLIVPNVTWAKKLKLAPSIVGVVTKPFKSSSNSWVYYRAIVESEGAEGGFILHLEKFKKGEEGAPHELLISLKQYISDIKGFKKLIDRIGKKSLEAVYGCCNPQNLKWTEVNELHFDLVYTERVFKKNGPGVSFSHNITHNFACRSSSLDQYKIDLFCKPSGK